MRRQIEDERGVWSVMAMSVAAAVIAAALALTLDLAAVGSTRLLAQSALDTALHASAHALAPSSIPSSGLIFNQSLADQLFRRSLRQTITVPRSYQIVNGPAFVAGTTPSLRATIRVISPLPALFRSSTIQVHEGVVVGWSAH